MSTIKLHFGPGLAPHPGWSFTRGFVEVPNDGQTWTEEMWRERERLNNEDMRLKQQLALANYEVMCDIEKLMNVPAIYQALFHRTRIFTATVRDLVNATTRMAAGMGMGVGGNAAPQRYWADAACLLVDWTVNVLRHEKIGFERFLQSQRESIYWILDNALLQILVDQWEDKSSRIPWDKATAPICFAMTEAYRMIPEWAERDLEEMLRWVAEPYVYAPKEALEEGYFKRSRKFLEQSLRIHEIWRTVRMGGKGLLPAELASVIVEDVSAFEELPTGDLRTLYFTKGKGKG